MQGSVTGSRVMCCMMMEEFVRESVGERCKKVICKGNVLRQDMEGKLMKGNVGTKNLKEREHVDGKK